MKKIQIPILKFSMYTIKVAMKSCYQRGDRRNMTKIPRKVKLPGYGEIEIPPQTELEKKTDKKWKKRNKKLLEQFNK